MRTLHVYVIHELLQLAVTERADHLRVHVGAAPALLLAGSEHVIEGPAVCAENVDEIFREVGGSRKIRECRAKGVAEFIYRFNERTDFVVQVLFDGETLHLDFTRKFISSCT